MEFVALTFSQVMSLALENLQSQARSTPYQTQ